MSKKILIAVCIVLAIAGVVILTQNKSEQKMATKSSYSYADGSGNVYNLDSTAMTIEYDPITLAESSSGMYSGGSYAKKEITFEQYETVASLFEKAAANQAVHIPDRIKGSGAVTIAGGTQVRDFILNSDASEKIEIEKALKELLEIKK